MYSREYEFEYEYSRATRARHARAVKLLVSGTVPVIPPCPSCLPQVGKEEKALKALRLAYRYNHLREKNPQYPVKAVALPPVAAEDGSRWKLKCCGRSLYNLDEVSRATHMSYV